MQFNGKKAAVSITFDDGLMVQAKYAAPELDKRGMRGTFFLCGKHVERDKELWLDVAKRHEIGSHSQGHFKATKLSAEDLKIDATLAKHVLSDRLSVQVVSYAWPYAISDEASQKVISTVYRQARGGHGSPGHLFAAPPLNFFDTPAMNTCAGNVEQIPGMLRKLCSLRGWLTLMLHGVGPDDKQFDNITSESFTKLLDVLQKDDDIWVAPYGDVADNLRSNRK